MFKVKWTPAQILIFHLAISGLISAVVAGLLAAGQYIVATGLNLPELGRIFAVAFLASMGACYLSIKNNPNTAQAEVDSFAELKGLVMQLIPQQIAPPSPPVVINVTHPPTVEPPTPQPSIRSLNAFPVPPRPIAQPPIQMPVVVQPDIAAQNTAQVPVPPQPVLDVPQRSFDSGVLRAVQAGQ